MKKLLFISLIVLSFGCKKDEDINNKPVINFQYTEQLDKVVLVGTASDKENDKLTYTWRCDDEDIKFKNPNALTTYFNVPEYNENTDVNVSLTVEDGINTIKISKQVTISKMTDIRKFGLGMKLVKHVSVDIESSVYIDQASTGEHHNSNCGPTCATMALKWYNSNFKKDVEYARSKYKSDGAWWSTDDVKAYLRDYQAKVGSIKINDINSLKNYIDENKLIILCLDMHYIQYQENKTYRRDCYFKNLFPNQGHFIVVKGYCIVDDQLFYEVYDPASSNTTYEDGTYVGLNRYYTDEDIDKATNKWYDYCLTIEK